MRAKIIQAIDLAARAIDLYQLTIREHLSYQKLHSLWHAVWRLSQTIQMNKNIKLKLLSINHRQYEQELDETAFDRQILYRLMVTNEFYQPGGEPFSLVCCCYDLELDAAVFRKYYSIHTFIAQTCLCVFAYGLALQEVIENTAQVSILKSQRISRWQNELDQIDMQYQVVLTNPLIYIRESENFVLPAVLGFAQHTITLYHNFGWFKKIHPSHSAIPQKTHTLHRFTNKERSQLACAQINVLIDQADQNYQLFNQKPLQDARDAMSLFRFIHLIQQILRQAIGQCVTSNQINEMLLCWLHQYTAAQQVGQTYRYPLLGATIESTIHSLGHASVSIQLQANQDYLCAESSLFTCELTHYE